MRACGCSRWRAGAAVKIAGFDLIGSRNFVYYDIAEDTELLATGDERSIWTVNLRRTPYAARRLYTVPSGYMLDDLVSIRQDSSAVVAGIRPIGRLAPVTGIRVRTSDGAVTRLLTKAFFANHWQHSPNNPVLDRLLARPGQPATHLGLPCLAGASGRLLWNQRSPTGGELLVGHELWCRRPDHSRRRLPQQPGRPARPLPGLARRPQPPGAVGQQLCPLQRQPRRQAGRGRHHHRRRDRDEPERACRSRQLADTYVRNMHPTTPIRISRRMACKIIYTDTNAARPGARHHDPGRLGVRPPGSAAIPAIGAASSRRYVVTDRFTQSSVIIYLLQGE
ncbi:MAG: hypothetical protein U1E17_05130 [Geminicoccaceae bacterium]